MGKRSAGKARKQKGNADCGEGSFLSRHRFNTPGWKIQRKLYVEIKQLRPNGFSIVNRDFSDVASPMLEQRTFPCIAIGFSYRANK
jgi:hypothetical protein